MPMRPAAEPDCAWKMIDTKDAHYLAAGSLRLGRPEDYAALENGRADGLDSQVIFAQGFMSRDREADRSIMQRLRQGGTAVGNVWHVGLRPAYIFCMTIGGHSFDPD